MPIINIYLKDKLFIEFARLSEGKRSELRKKCRIMLEEELSCLEQQQDNTQNIF